MIKILFVEDDHNLGMLLKENLKNKGYETTWCRDGEEGIDRFRRDKFNLCILDVMLPYKDGFSLSKEIKQINTNIPIIFLTARCLQDDRIKGFELGCDDYITKPFSTQELCMRIGAILKRSNGHVSQTKHFQLGKFLFDATKMTLQIGEEQRKLSSKESELLHILSENKNELVQRNTILEKVWGNDDYFSAKSMDVYISKIRKMLKSDPSVEILNAYGVGFKMIINE